MNKRDPLSYVDSEGQKAVVAGDMTFFFTSANRSGLVDAYELAFDYIGKNIVWYRTQSMTRPKKADAMTKELLRTWFKPGAKLRAEYELTLTSGEGPDVVGPWGLRFGLEPPLLPDVAGFFEISVPRENLAENPAQFRDLALELANRIEFRSGLAGYGAQYDEGELDDDRDLAIAAWCARYLALDYREFAATSEFMGNSVKGVSWLTFIDNQFFADVEGDAWAGQLPPGVSVHKCKYGIMLQAGARPILGDKNKREDISAYQEVYHLLEPIIVKEDLALPGLEDDKSLEWVNRFA